ncbi:protein of unknown function [Taphrina deformans PYCC 5710]|uniref:FRG1-like family protein n=1 Tax=Taphrina deformans (strain PYCC 5710 / ATCC 11124 / CBS 356.35 / IMI 108563 / JCM 9778 / NBRC 8474) TaxID=1097556 RepID=R4XGR5_TAPDE|nr:protein of unknown function [Taphrina deformans PYCC 5710]|eukprot:CCG83672.1 protein of unknown function [Taphrina deformans PYCC 5710]
MSVKRLAFKGEAPRKKKKLSRPATGDSGAETKVATTKTQEDQAEGWTDAESLDDLQGPIMIAYAFDSAVSLVADARGSVFTIPLEPDSVKLSDAEPHDVRQVFVASAILSRPAGVVSLKNGATAKYLSTDRFGDIRCEKDAISPSEEWTFVKRPDGWSIQSSYETFVSISQTAVRADVQEIGFCETFRIRMQAQNKSRKAKVGVAGGKALTLLSRKELEEKCGRKLSIEEVDTLRHAQKSGELGEAILDIRVKGRSDKFG